MTVMLNSTINHTLPITRQPIVYRLCLSILVLGNFRLGINFIKIMLMSIMLLATNINTYANTFGQSCSALPNLDTTNYLINDTAYGFIQKSLDMKTHVTDACLAAGSEFKFCIKNQTASPVCTPVTMNIGETARLGSLTTNTDITGKPSLANVPLTIAVVENEICLIMPTSRGMMPVMCRDKAPTGVVGEDVEEICRTLGKSCYDGRSKSQSLLSFSGLTIHCLRDTLNKVFYVGNECPAFEDDITFTMLRPFPEFQNAMKMAVRGALILYVMVYGFQVVMNGEYAHLNKIALFLMKFLLVVYFSVGLGAKTIEYGREVQHNGMTEFALPILVELTSNFTEYVFLAGGAQGLCNFDKSKYETGYEFYKIWDAIDCRIGYYLGMQLFYNMGTMIGSLVETGNNIGNAGSAIDWGDPGDNGIEVLGEVGSLTFFTVMFGFFMAGNIIIVMMGLVFAVVFMSVLLYFLTAYLVCMVTLYALAYISPIFVPMALFERTKGYFDSWLKLVISCTLQPAVIGGFIALLLTVYDSSIYGNCEYKRHDYSAGEYNFSTFELRLPAAEVEKCEASMGYKLMKYSLGHGWEKKIIILFEIPKINDYLNIALGLLYVILYVIVFYFFIQSVNEFASDLVGGPSLASVTVNPNAIIDKVKNVAMAAVLAASAAVKAKAGDKEGAMSDASEAADKVSEDTSSNKRGGASDKMSVGGSKEKEASDSASTGDKTGGGG